MNWYFSNMSLNITPTKIDKNPRIFIKTTPNTNRHRTQTNDRWWELAGCVYMMSVSWMWVHGECQRDVYTMNVSWMWVHGECQLDVYMMCVSWMWVHGECQLDVYMMSVSWMCTWWVSAGCCKWWVSAGCVNDECQLDVCTWWVSARCVYMMSVS